MASRSGIQIGKRAQALAVALALGAVALSLMPGQTAYAARNTSNEAGDADPGADSGTGSTSRKPTVPNPNDLPKCTLTTSDGTVHFYLPGEDVIVVTQYGEKRMTCGGPDWIVWRPDYGSDVKPGGGGVYTTAP